MRKRCGNGKINEHNFRKVSKRGSDAWRGWMTVCRGKNDVFSGKDRPCKGRRLLKKIQNF